MLREGPVKSDSRESAILVQNASIDAGKIMTLGLRIR
jgi:hypothetical protein